jgi:hypothetical protein
MQVTYIGNTTFKRGNDFGEPPAGTIVLVAGEQISSIFGNSDWGINSIGFSTSIGTVYGPWGGPRGSSYSVSGPVYGFYGGLWGDVLGSFGIWTTDPPQPPTPTPASNPAGMMRSKMFGGSLPNDTLWDDGSSFAGNPLLARWNYMRCSHMVYCI